MGFDKIAWIFDSRVDPPESVGNLVAFVFRWTVITFLCGVLGLVALFVAGFCVDFDIERMMMLFPYVRAGAILVLCCFMVYATYRNAVYRNRRKQKEDEDLYREIAAYYRERKSVVSDGK